MRRFLLLTLVLAALACAAPAQARLFWQTYGATVASPDGSGCAWNMGMDYFVPRTCDSCRYDLYSACKTSHCISPACNNLHPIYSGYCTPYGACHYKRRDHVYKKHCGCTPLACTYGPWELDKCRKHCRRTPELPCGAGTCENTPLVGCAGPVGSSGCSACGAGYGSSEFRDPHDLPNVEPFGHEILGTVQAFPAGMGGASMVGASAMPMMPGASAMPGMMPGAVMPTATPGFGSSNFTIPGVPGT